MDGSQARNRRPERQESGQGGRGRFGGEAATQGPKDKPFALFGTLRLPRRIEQAASWLKEVEQTVKERVEKTGGLPGPFDWVVFTKHSSPVGEPGGADRQGTGPEWLPRTTKIPPRFNQAVIAALRKYGIIRSRNGIVISVAPWMRGNCLRCRSEAMHRPVTPLRSTAASTAGARPATNFKPPCEI